MNTRKSPNTVDEFELVGDDFVLKEKGHDGQRRYTSSKKKPKYEFLKLDEEVEMSTVSKLDYTDNSNPGKYRIISFNRIGPFIHLSFTLTIMIL